MEIQENSKVAMSEVKIGIEAPIVVSQISDKCLYSDFFGRLDSLRIKLLTDRMLEVIELSDNVMIIIDLSNVEILDSAVASHLIKIGNTLSLVGVQVVFCGIKSVIAQTMTALGVEFNKFMTVRDLKTALKIVYELEGLKLVKVEKS